MIKIYVGAPLCNVEWAREVSKALRQTGFEVVSTWHSALATEDPRSKKGRRLILEQNKSDLSRADLMVALTSSTAGKGVYGEIGRFLEKGLPIVWCQGPNGEGASIDDADSLVKILIDPCVREIVQACGEQLTEVE